MTREDRKRLIMEAVDCYRAGDSTGLDLLVEIWHRQNDTLKGINAAGNIAAIGIVVMIVLWVFL